MDDYFESLSDVVFPWNDMIDMTGGSEQRAIGICLSAIFDAIQGLRRDVRTAASLQLAQPTCSFDLAKAITVEHCSDPDEANGLLQEGWVLVFSGVDGNGFPMFLMAQPSEEWEP